MGTTPRGGRGDIDNPNRAYPPPRGLWLMAMDWADLLFMHWRVEPAQLRPFVPAPLEIETFDGSAWLGIVPFEMRGTRVRLMPPIPGLSGFPELNVRTYVRPVERLLPALHRSAGPGGAGDDRGSGVWFFSLDAASVIAVEVARATFSLSYFRAAMSIRRRGGWIEYEHRRTDANDRIFYGPARDERAAFIARYRPTGPVYHAGPGSLERFLMDRYRLYAWRPVPGPDGGRLYAGEIHHPPWRLQPAEAEVRTNTMGGFLGLETRGDPLLHYSRYVKVAGWPARRIELA